MANYGTAPAGWRTTTLGALGRYTNGRAFTSTEWVKTGRPIIRIQDLTGSNNSPHYFDGDVEERHIVRRGDLLISWSGSLGAYLWDGPEAVLNQHIFKVESGIDKRFHYHLARAIIADLQGKSHGSGMVHVTKRIFEETPVIIPDDPLRQQELANFIDTLETAQGSASGHLESARRTLQQFRQSLLAQAYEEAVHDGAGKGLVQLGSILAEPLKNGYSAQPVPYETATKVLTLTATTSGYFDGRHFKFTDQTFSPESAYWVRDGDIYVQRGNTAEFVGVPALYQGPDNQFLFPDLMIRVRAQPQIAPRFLWYMLLAPQARAFLRDRATGSAGNMPKINHSVLEATPTPMASERVRADLVARLDAALAGAEAVKSRLDETDRTLALLARNVLAKCFGEGVFVAQMTPSVRESGGS